MQKEVVVPREKKKRRRKLFVFFVDHHTMVNHIHKRGIVGHHGARSSSRCCATREGSKRVYKVQGNGYLPTVGGVVS